MSTDQAISLQENITSIHQVPAWRLALRVHPGILNPQSAEKISAETPQVLLVMHCTSKRLLVISNMSIAIYKIPSYKVEHPKTGLGKVLASAGGIIKIVLAFLPIGELVDAFEKLLAPVEWLWHRISGKARKEREEALEVLLNYDDAFLLANYFKWKTPFKASLLNPAQEPITITVELAGIRIVAGRKKVFASYLSQDWGPLQMAKELIDHNRQALEAKGWSVRATTQGYVFSNAK